MAVRVFKGISQLVTMNGQGTPTERLGVTVDHAMAVDTSSGTILAIEPEASIFARYPMAETCELEHALVMPTLVDAHTHLLYAGDRAADFEARIRGESYAAIAARGGGIATTVSATRQADDESLLALAHMRLDKLAKRGVGSIEVKSGYGLSLEEELRALKLIARLKESRPEHIVSTLLLHMVPAEWREKRGAWVKLVCEELLPQAKGLADHVDIFCETSAYSVEESKQILSVALSLGFPIKAHVEQLSALGFGETAAKWGALSLEHLEHASEAVITAMADSQTRAVLLPTASLFLGDTHKPPVVELRKAGVPFVVATDLNPGSSPCFDPWLAGTLAATWYGLEPAEALLGMTYEAAKALNISGGCLQVGGRADFLVCSVTRWQELLYGLGHEPVRARFLGGVAQ